MVPMELAEGVDPQTMTVELLLLIVCVVAGNPRTVVCPTGPVAPVGPLGPVAPVIPKIPNDVWACV